MILQNHFVKICIKVVLYLYGHFPTTFLCRYMYLFLRKRDITSTKFLPSGLLLFVKILRFFFIPNTKSMEVIKYFPFGNMKTVS